MLFSRTDHNTRGFYGLSGLGAADENVAKLQVALAELARVTQRSNIDPGPPDGEMTDRTMQAIAASLGILTEELPTWAYVGLQAGMIFGSTNSTAKSAVTKYAEPLAAAASLAASKYAAGHPVPAGGNGLPVEEPWYKTPLGIGGIVVGLFVAYKIFIADSSQKAAA